MEQRIKKLKNEVQNIRDSLSEVKGTNKLLTTQISEESELLAESKELHTNMKKATEVLTLVQESSQELVKGKFEEMVTSFIRFVTDNEGYDFQIEFGKKGNLNKAKFLLKAPTTGDIYLPISETSGGGLKDIISTSLRVITMQFLDSPPVLMLDESFKALSANYSQKAVEFLNTLTSDLEFQNILVTHREAMKECADNIIEIGESDL